MSVNSNVNPRLVIHNSGNRSLCNGKAFSYFTLRHPGLMKLLNLGHAFYSQFCSRSKKPTPIWIRAFFVHIMDVVFLRPYKKMPRIYAGSTIAFRAIVQNLHPIWNRSEMNHVRQSVRGKIFRYVWDFYTAIPVCEKGILPKPTSCRESYLAEKPRDYFNGNSLRQKMINDFVGLHNKFVLFCHALGGSNRAGALSDSLHNSIERQGVLCLST